MCAAPPVSQTDLNRFISLPQSERPTGLAHRAQFESESRTQLSCQRKPERNGVVLFNRTNERMPLSKQV